MNDGLTQKQRNDVREVLTQRVAELRADLHRELIKRDEEQYATLAGRVADPGEKSVADLLVDLDLAEISRDIGELRDCEDALLRVSRGEYGICVDCGSAIGRDRLTHVPQAARCLECQERFEQQQTGGRAHPTL